MKKIIFETDFFGQVMDALVKAGVLPDDSQETVYKLTAEYKGVDKEDPRALITVIAS